jgi:hypothetical protein
MVEAEEEVETVASEKVEDFAEEIKEEADENVETLQPIEEDSPYYDEDLDDLDDEDYEDEDDLTEAENLDDILDREGIEITDGDTVGNIMEMYNAGFSIIEISKVMNVGVSEVKYVIDSHQGDY